MFKSRLVELRKVNNFTQAKLGALLGVTQQAVGKWEKGIAEPDIDLLNKIAQIFGVSTDFLLGNDMESQVLAVDENNLLNIYRELGRKKGTSAQSLAYSLIKQLLDS